MSDLILSTSGDLDIRERARAALREREAAEDLLSQQEAERQFKALAPVLIRLVDEVLDVRIPESAVYQDHFPVCVRIDGLRFTAEDANDTLYLIGQCPRCAEATVAEVGSLVQLGRQMEEFTPSLDRHPPHRCPGRQKPAALLAAAEPDLLAACRAAFDYLDHTPGTPETLLRQIASAVLKTEGEGTSDA